MRTRLRPWQLLPLCALLLAAVHAPPKMRPPANAGWSQFRQNERNEAVVRGDLHVAWRIETGGGFSSSPTAGGGHLFIGNNLGRLFSLNLHDGTVDWSSQFASSLMSAPILWNDTLYVSEGDQISYPDHAAHATVVGRGLNAIVALDARTGSELWRHPLAGTGMPSAAILDGTLVHHDGAGNVVGLDAASGHLKFVRNIGSYASMSSILPISADRFVTTGESPNAIYAMRAKDGTVVWKHEFAPDTSGFGDCPPASDGDAAFCDYLAPGPRLRSVDVGNVATEHAYAVTLGDGSLVWDTPLLTGTVPRWNQAAIPLVYSGMLVVGSSLGPQVSALDPRTGKILWRATVRGPVKGGIVGVGDALYFGDLSGRLWALDARDGHVLGVKDMHAPFNVSSPIVVGETLIIGSKTGAVIAIPLAEIRAAHDP